MAQGGAGSGRKPILASLTRLRARVGISCSGIVGAASLVNLDRPKPSVRILPASLSPDTAMLAPLLTRKHQSSGTISPAITVRFHGRKDSASFIPPRRRIDPPVFQPSLWTNLWTDDVVCRKLSRFTDVYLEMMAEGVAAILPAGSVRG